MDPVAITSTETSPLLVGAVVAAVMTLSEVVKVLASRLSSKRSKADEDASTPLALAMARIVEAQERMFTGLNGLSVLFAAHDRADALTFQRMTDALGRIEETADANADRLAGFANDHAAALKKLDEIERKHDEHDRRVMEAVALQKQIRDSIGS